MTTFRTATGNMLTEQIRTAQHRVVFVAPGVSQDVAAALVDAHQGSRSVTVVLDADEDVCRIGYGDVQGFDYLQRHGDTMDLRTHSGVRLGLLMADRVVTIWSPQPRSVDGDRKPDQPNAIVLDGGLAGVNDAGELTRPEPLQQDARDAPASRTNRGSEGAVSLADQLAERLADECVGEKRIRPEDLAEVVKELKDNPPAPFDLARKVRVFSTKFQYVEAELQGAEWTERRIRVSSLLLNSDLPESLQDILETQVRPYRTKGDVAIEVPHIVRGQIAYNQLGREILVPTTQRDLEGTWKDIKDRYLFRIPGFGTLVRKRELVSFREEAGAFERVLQGWVTRFRLQAKRDETQLVSDIVLSIRGRIEQSGREREFDSIDLDVEVRRGLERMRVIQPRVRIVIKDVSWESSRDREFTTALRTALPAEDLKGWFDEFTAAQEKR